jgi:hypothetical protein
MRLREILQFSDPQLVEALRNGADAIEKTHRFPDLAPIPLVQSRARSEQGGFVFQSRPNRAVRMEISKYAEFPSLTLIHEVGHVLDAVVLNPLRDGFGSDVDPAFEAFLLRISGTRAVRGIARLLANRYSSLRFATIRLPPLFEASGIVGPGLLPVDSDARWGCRTQIASRNCEKSRCAIPRTPLCPFVGRR